ncbi:MAG TPA: preprotein translocase subunit SecE [Candidatus Paceibacterota bacterium]|nr:preprotein translocase subunit SecE [Candidatus Paceibacterota bacterium]
MTGVLQFLREVRVELGKVAWPTRRQLVNYTLIVLGASLVMAAFLGGLDALFAFILGIIVN